MTNNSSNINESAKRYAKALMLSSVDNDSLISNFKNDYEKLLSLYEKNLSFRNFILTPLIKTQKKKDLLIKILNKTKDRKFKVDTDMMNLLGCNKENFY